MRLEFFKNINATKSSANALMQRLFILILVSTFGCVSQTPTATQTKTEISKVEISKSKSKVRNPASLNGVEIKVRGGDENSFFPPPSGNQIINRDTYDVIVVGGGLAGLSSAVYLTDAGKRVLLLEKEAQMGGLAAWGDAGPELLYDRGAAYFTDAYEEEKAILNHIGMRDYRKKHAIPEPIDSYLVRNEFFPGIWEHEALEKLPASFDLFQFQLRRAEVEGLIPNQPFEEYGANGGNMALDRLSAREWIDAMPATLQKSLATLEQQAATAKRSKKHDVKKNPHFALSEAKRILQRFENEMKAGKLTGPTGMYGVIELIDLYCRSALGHESQFISAMAFANFYISEVEVRYTTPKGTGIAAYNMTKMLLARKKLATLLTKSPAIRIVPGPDKTEVSYLHNGNVHLAKAKYVVFAAQLKVAPKVIEGFAAESPNQAQLMSQLGYSHYSVHALHVEGHPFRATYDTWIRASDYTDNDPTDLILGRWMDPKMRGYEGYRDFQKDPEDSRNIISIYQPLNQSWMANGAYNDEKAIEAARTATIRIEEIYSKLPNTLYRGPMKIKKIETSRWPYSVHIAGPGHYIEKAKILRKPFKTVFFANNNIGTPTFEEALFRGHCAADNILKRMDPKFQFEKWTKCPID